MSAANNFNLESRNWIGNLNMTGTINAGAISGTMSITVGSVIFLSGINYKVTMITGNYTALTTDYIIAASFPTSGTGVITLPNSSPSGTTHIIKDDSGNASSNSFIISGFPNIDGTGNFRITDNYGSITIYKGINGWRII